MKIGTDIVSIGRIENALNKHGDSFKNRFLTPQEIEQAKNTSSVAGLWAAKEAISKAFGCGIGAELGFHDIVISKNGKSAPYFELSQRVEGNFKYKSSSLSISHDGGFAIAVAIVADI